MQKSINMPEMRTSFIGLIKKGFRNNNCINLFFAFQKRFNRRSKYYINKYNFNPNFKAGLHFEKLMVDLIGTIKKT